MSIIINTSLFFAWSENIDKANIGSNTFIMPTFLHVKTKRCSTSNGLLDDLDDGVSAIIQKKNREMIRRQIL